MDESKNFMTSQKDDVLIKPVYQQEYKTDEKPKNSEWIPKSILKSFPDDRTNEFVKFPERKKFNWSEYHDFEAIVSFMYEMRRRYAHLVKIINIGRSSEGRPLLVLRIASSQARYYEKIFIEGGIHAREWISPAVVTYIIHRMLHRWWNLPSFMRTKIWLFLPVLNPDGYVYSWTEDRMWRKNRSKHPETNCIGVDLNRNFSVGWDKNTHTDSCHLNFKGMKPFSEPETRALRDFLLPQKRHLKGYISYHSYGQEIRYLWNFNIPVEREERVTEIAKRAAENMRLTTGQKYNVLGKYGTKGMFGNSRDWARKILGINYCYLIELRDKGQNGFNLPTKEIIPSGHEGYEFIKTVAQAISDDRNGELLYKKTGVKISFSKEMSLYAGTVYIPLGRHQTQGMYGNSRDWARKALGVDYAYLVELRDTGEAGFLLPAKEIIATSFEAFEFLKTIAQAIQDDRTNVTPYKIVKAAHPLFNKKKPSKKKSKNLSISIIENETPILETPIERLTRFSEEQTYNFKRNLKIT